MSRYSRHIDLKGFGIEGQEALARASVLVVGAGGLGVPVLQYLNAMGVGKLGIVDGDTVCLENLQRQVIYGDQDIGRLKVDCAFDFLTEKNPETTIKSYPYFLDTENALELLGDYDLIVDASDNFGTRYLVNDACVILNKPFVYGGLHAFEGQVSVFNFDDGPSYRCLFPIEPSATETPNCNEYGVLGILPGIIGNLMALEVVKVLTGIGVVLSGTLLSFDALHQESRKIRFKKRLESFAIHSLKSGYQTPCSVQEITARELLAEKSGILIDVRTVEEFEADHLPQAIHIPLNRLESELPERAFQGRVYFICATGMRSRQAVEWASSHLPEMEAVQVKGGMRALTEQV